MIMGQLTLTSDLAFSALFELSGIESLQEGLEDLEGAEPEEVVDDDQESDSDPIPFGRYQMAFIDQTKAFYFYTNSKFISPFEEILLPPPKFV